jgi:hypothetical protein
MICEKLVVSEGWHDWQSIFSPGLPPLTNRPISCAEAAPIGNQVWRSGVTPAPELEPRDKLQPPARRHKARNEPRALGAQKLPLARSNCTTM